MSELVMRFRGLCAIVPRGVTGCLKVLLIDATQRQFASDNRHVIEPHTACVEFDERLWKLTPGTLALEPYQFATGRSFLFLGGDELSLEGQLGGAAALQFDPTEIIPMATANPGFEKISPAFLNGTPPPKLVSARLTLDTGTFSKRANFTSPHWHFRALQEPRPPKSAGEPFAFETELHASFGSVSLVSQELDGCAKERWRLERAANQKAVLRVSNVEFTTAIDPSPKPNTLGPDQDFELYYKLCATQPTRLPVPHNDAPRGPGRAARCMAPFFAV